MELKIWEWKFWIKNLEFESYLKTLKKIFFGLTESTQFDWVDSAFGWVLSVGAEILAPHFFVSSFFLYASSFINFSSSIDTIHLLLPLDFSSYKKHFSKLLNSPSSISINISLDLCVLSIFIPHPFLVKPIFFALKWLLPPRDLLF